MKSIIFCVCMIFFAVEKSSAILGAAGSSNNCVNVCVSDLAKCCSTTCVDVCSQQGVVGACNSVCSSTCAASLNTICQNICAKVSVGIGVGK